MFETLLEAMLIAGTRNILDFNFRVQIGLVLSCQIEIVLKLGVSEGCKGSVKTSVWHFIYPAQYQQTKSPNNSPSPYQNLLLARMIVFLKSLAQSPDPH